MNGHGRGLVDEYTSYIGYFINGKWEGFGEFTSSTSWNYDG